MSLRYDTSRCPRGPRDENTSGNESSWLDAIIMVAPFIDLTRVDVVEYLWRVRYLERIGFKMTHDPMPIEMIQRWEGTTFNVSHKTRASFVNRWRHELIRDIDEVVRQEMAS